LIVEKEDRRQSGRLPGFWASGVLHLVITLFLGERERGIVLKNLSSFTLRPHVTKDRSFSARLVAKRLKLVSTLCIFPVAQCQRKYRK
jgi:hypothetical protein